MIWHIFELRLIRYLVFQEQAKDTLKRIVNEKLDAVKKLQDVEKTLSTTEDEFATLRELYDKNNDENRTLAGKHYQKNQDWKYFQFYARCVRFY